ncbi:MAG TPA: glycosyltransferase family 4 protein, partial [Acidimicrobiales bacterium]|nr:glycosyltransferase family 4 protein [Acidimicrobiales bacterium]
MKLGILTQYYPPEMGAPQARLSELAVRFVQAGHEVCVLTAMPSYPHGRIFDGYSGLIRVERLDGVSVTRTWSYASNSMQVWRRLANYGSFMASSALVGAVRLPALDYLMTETPPLFLGLSGWLLARWRRAKWILNVSDLWVESAVRLGVLHQGAALEASRRLESFLSRRADLITGQSRGIIEAIKQGYPSVPSYHLSNGVDANRFGPRLRSQAARAELGPDEATVAIYAGLLGIAQGIDQLLEAAARLRHLDGFRLVIIGDGPDAPRLRKMAVDLKLDNVSFLGPRPRDEVPALLASADIALVPLGVDLPGAVPSKLYEAMGSGLPV